MLSRNDFIELFENIKILSGLYFKILIHPESITNYTYAHTKRNKLKNKYVYLLCITVIFIFFLLKSMISGEGIYKSVNCILTVISFFLINIPPIITITILSNIKIEYKKYYFISILTIGLCFSVFQVLCLSLFLSFEVYLFYFISLTIGFLRLFWLCFWIPIRRNKQEKKKYKFIRPLKVLCSFLLTNTVITLISIFCLVPNIDSNRDTIILNDPIFTEVYNEYPYVLEKNKEIIEILEYICRFSKDDLYKNFEKREIINQKTNLVLLKKDEIDKRYTNLRFQKTKELYKGILECYESIRQINRNINQILNFDFEKTEKDIIEKQHLISKYQGHLKELGSKIENNIIKIESLQQQLQRVYDEINSLDENSYEELILEKKNEIIKLTDEIKSIDEESQKIQIELDNYKSIFINEEISIDGLLSKVEKSSNNTSILKNVVFLIQKTQNQTEKNLLYYKKIQKYIDWRIAFLWL